MATIRRWGKPSAQARQERERALGLAWDVTPAADVAEHVASFVAPEPAPTLGAQAHEDTNVSRDMSRGQPALRAEGAPVPRTPLEAEVERLERAMAEAWARWDAIEGRPSGKVTQTEVDAAWEYKRALEAYEAAVAKVRARQEAAE